jgi:hypothetical protein
MNFNVYIYIYIIKLFTKNYKFNSKADMTFGNCKIIKSKVKEGKELYLVRKLSEEVEDEWKELAEFKSYYGSRAIRSFEETNNTVNH